MTGGGEDSGPGEGSGAIDIPRLVEQLRDHRFEGYSDKSLADEIDAFRSGSGIGSIGNAVEALKAVAAGLAETDDALRRELGKLGVVWQGKSGGQAGAVLTEQAGFSRDANAKVGHSAEMIFAQGESFSRALHKLPDTAALRTEAGSQGYSLGDALMSLIGFETDHAQAVRAGQEARQQAVDALNGYARESGDNLASTESLSKPESLQMVSAGSPENPFQGVNEVPDVGTTSAAQADGGKGPAVGPVSQPSRAPATEYPTAVPAGMPVRHTGSAPAPSQSTAPSSAPSAPAASTPSQPVTGGVIGTPKTGSGHTEVSRPFPGGTPVTGTPSTPVDPAIPPGAVVGRGPDSSSEGGKTVGRTGVPGVPGEGAGRGGVVGGVPVEGGGRSGGGGDAVLGKGRSFGTGPQTPGASPVTGPGYSTTPKAPLGGGEWGASATALGAAGAGGAVSGEPERQGRGVGRSGGSPRPGGKSLPIGDLPEEESKVSRSSEKLNPRVRREPASLMEHAAPQGRDGETDAEHVRKYGIDDKDLFADQRMVSPDVIGDDNAGDLR